MNERPWLTSYDEGVPQTLEYPEHTLPELLDQVNLRFPDVAALHYFGSKMTYRELNEKVNQFAHLLLKEGIKPGDRVALYLPNCPPCVIAYFGALRAGAILTQLNPLYSASETAHQLKDSGAQHVVSLDRFAPILQQVAAECGLKKVWLTRVNDYFPMPLKWLYPLKALKEKSWMTWPQEPLYRSFVEDLAVSPNNPVSIPLKMDDTALLQYTGGTTGVSKGVILTHRNLVANAYQCKYWFPGLPDGKEVFMLAIPIFHCYGMTAGMNMALSMAASMVLVPKFEVTQVLKAIDKYRVSIFPGVQAIYVAINNYKEVGKYDIHSIKACISGAGPLHQEVQKKFEELTGGKLVEGYGLTEASPVTHCNPVFGKRKIGTIGLPFVGTEAKIVDVQTGARELGVREIGELVVKGPQVMQGYWNHPEETKIVLKDGWLYTGDIGYMDEDGFFAIVDRKKDMVKVGGENVYPRDVEEVLFQHRKVLDCVVAGVPDEKLGDKVKAYIVLKPGQTAEAKEIIDFCRDKLAKFKVPKEVEFRDSLPKNMVGKMLRRLLVEEEKAKMKKS
ncbi:MAG TPA: long-chain fatty acid--CoA ligase [bacterium]|nr:long-chain fatty acid--CoA ligase [bacterium]